MMTAIFSHPRAGRVDRGGQASRLPGTIFSHSRAGRVLVASVLGLALLALVAVPRGHAAPPPFQLEPPFYSFDRVSPTVLEGFVEARDVLSFAFPHPEVAIPGDLLGLYTSADDLNALSGSNANLPAGTVFTLLVSVDRDTVGTAPPDPTLVALGRPYNVLDQAQRGHAAGDQFMALTAWTWTPGGLVPRAGRGGGTTSVRNNFDEGGTSYSATPPTHSRDTVPPGTAEDEVDSSSPVSSSAARGITNVYFTADRESPSLVELSFPYPPSGANLFYNEAPFERTPTTMFASFEALGLQPDDDIDALVIIDADANGVFDSVDTVLFSLTGDSPSLGIIPGTSSSGAGADVLIVMPGQSPLLFAAAEEFGLGAPADNIDAVQLFELACGDPLQCALDHAIRFLRGDWDDDGDVDFDDFTVWPIVLTGPDNGPYPPGGEFLDADEDGDLDLLDFAAFQQAFTG